MNDNVPSRLEAFRARLERNALTACKVLNPAAVAASFLACALSIMETFYGRSVALEWFGEFNRDLADNSESWPTTHGHA